MDFIITDQEKTDFKKGLITNKFYKVGHPDGDAVEFIDNNGVQHTFYPKNIIWNGVKFSTKNPNTLLKIQDNEMIP